MAPLLNTLASPEQHVDTPSRADGIPADFEDELRCYGCQLIQQAGILMKLPQRTMGTAQVLFQRFWYVTSFKSFSSKDVCLGALFLATKLEETPIRLRDLINVFDYLIRRALHASNACPSPRLRGESRSGASARNGKARAIDELQVKPAPFSYKPQAYFSQDFYDTKDAMVVAEMQILKRLGFNVQVTLPYATMINYLQLLGLTDRDRYPGVAQKAWSWINDSLQTPVHCLFPPHVIACAAVYFTALTHEPAIELPMTPAPWYLLFDVEEVELRAVCAHLLHLYNDESGLASRVREELGGMAYFTDKRKIRAWLEEHGAAGLTPDAATTGNRGAGNGTAAPAGPAEPWVLRGGPLRYAEAE